MLKIRIIPQLSRFSEGDIVLYPNRRLRGSSRPLVPGRRMVRMRDRLDRPFASK
jgi:hypothetical protein